MALTLVPAIKGIWRKSPAAIAVDARTGAKLPGAIVGSQNWLFNVARILELLKLTKG